MTSTAPVQTTAAPRATAASASGARLLQRKCGCGASKAGVGDECAACQGKRLQRKLALGSTSDPSEAEADRVAAEVLARPSRADGLSPAPVRIQRLAHGAAGGGTAPATVERVLTSPGRPLDLPVRADMERRFGHDFSRVRVHTGGEAERSAQEVNANAYTVGSQIVFGKGWSSRSSTDSRRLLAHELAHVVQQREAPRALQRDAADEEEEHEEEEVFGPKPIELGPLYEPDPRWQLGERVLAVFDARQREERNVDEQEAARRTAAMNRRLESLRLEMSSPPHLSHKQVRARLFEAGGVLPLRIVERGCGKMPKGGPDFVNYYDCIPAQLYAYLHSSEQVSMQPVTEQEEYRRQVKAAEAAYLDAALAAGDNTSCFGYALNFSDDPEELTALTERCASSSDMLLAFGALGGGLRGTKDSRSRSRTRRASGWRAKAGAKGFYTPRVSKFAEMATAGGKERHHVFLQALFRRYRGFRSSLIHEAPTALIGTKFHRKLHTKLNALLKGKYLSKQNLSLAQLRRALQETEGFLRQEQATGAGWTAQERVWLGEMATAASHFISMEKSIP